MNVDDLGKLLIAEMDTAMDNTNSSPKEKSAQIKSCDHKIREIIRKLAETKDKSASKYLLEGYSHPFPQSLYFPNGAGISASPCWVNMHLDVLIKCEINRALGHTGGENAFKHLMQMANRGYGVGQGMSYGSWIPDSAFEGLSILGDERSLGLLEQKIDSPFIGKNAQRAIKIIKTLNQQRKQLEISDKVRIFDVWIELEPDEINYDAYKVTKFIEYIFNSEYNTQKERDKENKMFGGNTYRISHPEDRFFEEIGLSKNDINVVKKYMMAKKKKHLLFKIGLGFLTRLYQIDCDLSQFFKESN